MRRLGSFAVLLASTLPSLSCASSQPDAKVIQIKDVRPGTMDVLVSDLEIRGLGGGDRFAECPPPGELGQAWAPAPFGDDAFSDSPAPTVSPGPADATYFSDGRVDRRTATERAVEDTLRGFKACVRRGTAREGSHQGRAAIVVRLAADGRIVRTEEYAACGLPVESILCMKDVAGRLKFTPEDATRGPIVIPAVFTDRAGDNRRPTSHDSYVASCYLALERVRPALHDCERAVRVNLRPVEARATFALTVDADGKVQNAHVDPWSGNKDLVECAAKALASAKFDKPPEGKGSVTARVVFNPRTSGYR